MLLGYVIDKLHDKHGLADACAAEQSDLTALRKRADKVNDLDTGLEHLGRGRELIVRRSSAVNGTAIRGFQRLALVYDITEHVENASERLSADRNGNPSAGIKHLGSPRKSVGRSHCYAANGIIADMLRYLDGQRLIAYRHCKRIIYIGQRTLVVKANIDDRSHYLSNYALARFCHNISPYGIFRIMRKQCSHTERLPIGIMRHAYAAANGK